MKNTAKKPAKHNTQKTIKNAISKVWLTSGFALLISAGIAAAAAPEPWQLNFQQAASPVQAQLDDFHDLLLIIITAISVFVMGLLAYACVRFRASANDAPSKTTHNVTLEILWTTIPVLILMVIAVPSFRILYYMDKAPNPSMTLKITGYQWYWGYEYPDHGGFYFDSYMIPDEDIQGDQVRLLSVDNVVVLPTNTEIRLLITASDVIHSWAMPAFGVKTDAIPGRINETWVEILEEGTYYGQCSEICGVGHAFMPIEVKAVSPEEFEIWVKEAQDKFADGSSAIEHEDRKSIELASKMTSQQHLAETFAQALSDQTLNDGQTF